MTNVLLIEDSLTEAAYVSGYLRKEGFTVTIVNTVEEAKKIVVEQQFSAIWLDVVLPDGSGFGLCRYFKKNEKTRNIPIILCTSKSEDIDKEWGTKQGASAYLTKPVEAETIVKTIRSFVSL